MIGLTYRDKVSSFKVRELSRVLYILFYYLDGNVENKVLVLQL